MRLLAGVRRISRRQSRSQGGFCGGAAQLLRSELGLRRRDSIPPAPGVRAGHGGGAGGTAQQLQEGPLPEVPPPSGTGGFSESTPASKKAQLSPVLGRGYFQRAIFLPNKEIPSADDQQFCSWFAEPRYAVYQSRQRHSLAVKGVFESHPSL